MLHLLLSPKSLRKLLISDEAPLKLLESFELLQILIWEGFPPIEHEEAMSRIPQQLVLVVP